MFDFIKIQISKRSFTDIISRIAEVILGYPLLFVSYLTPRTTKKILVGCHTEFNDNSKYFYLLAREKAVDKEIIWIANSIEVAKKMTDMGYVSYFKWSLTGLYHCLTSKYYIYCFHLIDINLWTSGNTVIINLWHGIPLKHIEFTAKNSKSSKAYNTKSIISRIFVLYIFIRPDFLISSSRKMSEYYQKAFRIRNVQNIVELGMPRCDMFFLGEKKRKSFLTNSAEKDIALQLIPKFSKTFVYMPTWRDYDFLQDLAFDFDVFNVFFKKHNFLLIFKLHPATKLTNNCTYSNINFVEPSVDIYPILPYTDCLITDYSSIYYDYLLLGKEVILFPFDKVRYLNEDRGFIEDFDTAMPGKRVYSIPELMESLTQENFLSPDELAKVVEDKWGCYSGNAVDDILKLIR
ncbi:CDP-glycerol glycerophosphotransferase family protein [Shewanella oncorhynchi]|uniref:CDP-glycerol glycerophosphotransferase family protein n=1 Tax=Shewanella oncorhynchi TaxID=2726434 RepID=UPI003D7A446C